MIRGLLVGRRVAGADNPSLPPEVGSHRDRRCPACGNIGVTVQGIDNERDIIIVECNLCGKAFSVHIRSGGLP